MGDPKESTKEKDVQNKNGEVVAEICFETKAYTTTESTEVKERRSRSKSKTKKFASDDLESMRADFARKQGVKEVLKVDDVEKEKEAERLADEALWKPAPAPYEAPDASRPKELPSVSKNDKTDQPKNGGLQKKDATGELKERAIPKTDKTPVQHSTSQVSNESESGSRSRSKSKNKAKKFAADDLEAMRAGFAKQQGVKEVKIVKDLPAVGGLRVKAVEEEEVFEEIMSPEEAQLLSQQQQRDDSSAKDNKKAGEEEQDIGGDGCKL